MLAKYPCIERQTITGAYCTRDPPQSPLPNSQNLVLALMQKALKRFRLFSFRPEAFCEVKEFFIENILVRIHFIIEIIWWTSLAPWEF